MSKLCYILYIMILCLVPFSSQVRAYSGGDGTPDSPYEISTAEELIFLGSDIENYSCSFILTDDLDLSSYSFTESVIATTADFTGCFDGNNHIISNLHINAPGVSNVGLFSKLNGAEIKNVIITLADISAEEYVGILAGRSESSLITYCIVNGKVSGRSLNTGGIYGWGVYDVLSKCSADVNASGFGNVGGIAGFFARGTLTYSSATGIVTGGMDSGGFSAGIVSNLYQASISNCYACCKISGKDKAGGICAYGKDSTIDSCYSASSIVAVTNPGSILAADYGCPVSNSFYNTELCSSDVHHSTGSTGLTSAEMCDKSFFINQGWDFVGETDNGTVDNWNIEQNLYPTFSWQGYSPVNVPNLLGLTYSQALIELNNVGLTPGLIQYSYNMGPKNVVYGQSIPAGSESYNMYLVSLNISLGDRYSGGYGTSASPYLISKVDDLLALGENTNDYNKYFRLVNDIDMEPAGVLTRAVIAHNPRVSWSFSGTEFTGVFDGNGKTISNLTIENEDGYYIGLFGRIGESSIVSNLKLTNCSIIGNTTTGFIAASSSYATLENCLVTGSMKSVTHSGGISGSSYRSVFNNCTLNCSIDATGDKVGGILGSGNSCTINNCAANVSITSGIPVYSSSATGIGKYAGGIAGYLEDTDLNGCYSSGIVNARTIVGGLVALNSGSIINCYSTCDVLCENSSYAGGIIAHNYGNVVNCIFVGSVMSVGEFTGALVGENSANVNNSYFYKYSGPNNQIGTAIDDLQIFDKKTYVGFDFVGDSNDGIDDIWNISNGNIPYLTWQNDEVRFVSPLTNVETTLLGSGSHNDPFIIASKSDLLEFSSNPGLRIGYYSLESDINLSGYTFSQAVVTGIFNGTFLGNNHIIQNVEIDASENSSGFFSILTGNVSQLNLIGVSINARELDYAGGLSGIIAYSDIEDCYVVSNIIANDYVGGMAGSSLSLMAHNNICQADINAEDYSGGLFGECIGGVVSSCLTIDGTINGGGYSGGLIGKTVNVSIDKCYTDNIVHSRYYVGGLVGALSTCSVVSSVSHGAIYTSSWDVGGLIGHSYDSTIDNCYSTSLLDGSYDASGFVGVNNSTVISNCYSDGVVSDSYYSISGFTYYGNNIFNSFWDIDSSGQSEGILSGSTSELVGLSTEDMHNPDIFIDAGWDFVGETDNGTDDIWDSIPGQSPHLTCETMDMPDFTGMSLAQVQLYISKHYFSFGAVSYAFSDVPKGKVCFQSIESGAKVYAGQTVDVSLSLGIAFSGGNGSINDPYQISTAADLIMFSDIQSFLASDAYYVLTNNIDMSGHPFTNSLISPNASPDTDFTGIKFEGNFNGKGYTINDLTINNTEHYYTGLFGYISSNAAISNLKLVNANISGDNYTGALSGYSDGADVSACYVEGAVSGNIYVGGLIGRVDRTSLSNSVSEGSINGKYYSGGIAGYSYQSIIHDSYSLSDIISDDIAGGLIGRSNYSNLEKCYARGNVECDGSIYGGLIGYRDAGTVIVCMWDYQASGFGDEGMEHLGATAYSTAQMQAITTYLTAGWDFVSETANGSSDLWRMSSMSGYPILSWQKDIPFDTTGSYGIDILDFQTLAQQWLQPDQSLDIDQSGTVDLADLETFTEYWLK